MPAPIGPDRSFLDANVLFSAAYSERSIVRRIWSFGTDQVKLLTSEYAIDETRRNLPDRALVELEIVLRAVRVVTTPARSAWLVLPDVELPRKDQPILQAALAANATHLITGDRKHFGRYYGRRVNDLRIVSPDMYEPTSM